MLTILLVNEIDLQNYVRMMQKGIQHLRCRNLENLHPSCRFVKLENVCPTIIKRVKGNTLPIHIPFL